MKFLNWLGKAGKMTTATIAGLTAVGGAAVVGASLLYLQEPSDNNSFNLGGDQNTNIVYASGGNRDYGVAAPGATTGEMGSSIYVSSGNIDRLDQQAIREQRLAEMAESERNAQQAYAMSGGEGLRSGNTEYEGDRIATENFGGQTAGMMANMQQMMNQAMSGAVPPGAQGGQGPAAPGQEGQAGAPSLASAGRPDWGHSAALGGRSGGNGQAGANQFVMQANGRGKAVGEADVAMSQMGDVMRQAQEQARSMMGNGPKQNSARFGSGANLDNGLDSFGRGRERAIAGDRVTRAFKVSAEGSKNKNRAANEAGKAWLDSNRITGGLTVDSGNVSTGQGMASKDFEGALSKGMKNMQGKFDEMIDTALQRQEDVNKLQKLIWSTVLNVVLECIAILILLQIAKGGGPFAFVFWAAAGLTTLLAGKDIYDLFKGASDFADKWGSSGLSNTAKWVGAGLGLGVGLSWVFGVTSGDKSFLGKMVGKFANLFGISTGSASGALGIGGALGFLRGLIK